MEVPGNPWREAWDNAKPVPARRQKRLFDDTREAEKSLQYLSALKPGESATMRVCWLVEGHAYYVALKTAAGCVPYTVTLSFSSSPSDIAACYHDESGAVQRSHLVQHLPEQEHNHFRYDTGVPLSYMDFKVHVGWSEGHGIHRPTGIRSACGRGSAGRLPRAGRRTG